jgi:succinate dehydrogenase/fumarate reductase flavoprotein subunit
VPDLIVAGAGMAGLCAAAQARELGADVLVLEKASRPGGSMLLSSGFVWRHTEFDDFRRECPAGDPALQRLVHDRLDADMDWLEGLGASPTTRETGNPLTTGRRFDPAALTDTLALRAGEVRLSEPLAELPAGVPVVLATGGFQADRELVRRHITPEADHLLLRAAPGSNGDGLRLGLAAGGATSNGLEQFYGRNMPAPPATLAPEEFVSASQLYARHATVRNARGEQFETRTWSEIDVVQWTARQPGARAWYSVSKKDFEQRVREHTVADMVESAERAGAPVERSESGVIIEVAAAITTTIGGLRVDERAQAAPGVYAAGADAGGIATGGYASGLAAALVLGRVAAQSALEDAA